MKKTLTIKDYEDKKSKTGDRFTRFNTSEGYMSCFDKEVAKQLKDFEGKQVSVEIKEVGTFKNLVKLYGIDLQADEEQEIEVVDMREKISQTKSTGRVDRAKALELTIELLQYQKEANNVDLTAIFNMADEIYNYITQ